MKKKTVAILLALVLIVSCSVVVFAATDTSSSFGLFDALKDIAAFIRRIFVPKENYFHNKLGEMSAHVNERFGGLAYLYRMLDNFFNTLKQTPTAELIMKIPSNFLFRGYKGLSLDVFTSAKPYISFLRSFLSAGFCVFTGIICYKKLLTFFNP